MEQIFSAQVAKVSKLSSKVYQVFLQPQENYPFLPGQYTQIQTASGQWLAFSLASLPNQPLIELHIQQLDTPNSQELFASLQPNNLVNLKAAQGECALPASDQPLTLVAASTGFAQIKSLVEEAISRNWQSPITLYWAAHTLEDLYLYDLAQSWAAKLANFKFIPCLETPPANWQGATGLVTHALAKDFTEENSAKNLAGFICGSPAMVYAVEDLLMEKGMPAKALLSDVHSYMPR